MRRTRVFLWCGIVLLLVVGASFVGLRYLLRTREPHLIAIRNKIPFLRRNEALDSFASAAVSPDAVGDELRKALAEYQTNPFRMQNCQLDLTASCLASFTLTKRRGKTYLVKRDDKLLDQQTFYSLSYADPDRVLMYEVIPTSIDTQIAKGIDTMWQAGQEWKINPLVISLFVRMVNNPDYVFVKGMSQAVGQKLRDYLSLYQGKLAFFDRIGRFSNTEQRVWKELAKNTTFTAAEKAILTMVALSYDHNAVGLFAGKWKAITTVYERKEETELSRNTLPSVGRDSVFERTGFDPNTPPALGFCFGESFQRCELQEDIQNQQVLCQNITELDAVCKRSVTLIGL